MQCPICNKVVSESARFCDQCGHDLQQQPISEAEPIIEEQPPVLVEAQVESELVEQVVDLDMDHNDSMVTIQPPEPVEGGRERLHRMSDLLSDQLDPLPEEPAMDPAITGELPVGPRLVLQGDEAIYTLSVGQEIIIGREDPIDGIYPDIDLTPHDADTGVSRQHASLHEQGGQWFIKDLASTNYTIVNRRRLTAHEDFLLEDGDELRFGRVVAEFKM